MNDQPSRRHFLRKATAASFLASLPAWVRAEEAYVSERIDYLQTRFAANDNINLGLIGTGGRGIQDIERALTLPGTKLVAACDVYDGRLRRAKELWGNDVAVTRDYKELLARKDIDAVVIAGTHHWNAQMCEDALKAGKHVYVEKPMVHKLPEGPRVIAAEKAAGKVFMVGSQRVSNVVYEKARELYRKGMIGELNYVEAWWDRFSHTGAWQYSIAPDASPSNIDWSRFIGNAPKADFDPMRLFRWRNYKDYSNGVAGDLFVHLFSGLHFIIDSNGPEKVYATGGIRFWKDGRDVPDLLLALCDYGRTKTHAPFNLMLRTNFADAGGGSTGFRFVGSEGVMSLDRDIKIEKRKLSTPGYNLHSFPADLQEEYKRQHALKYPPAVKPAVEEPKSFDYKAPEKYNDLDDHLLNFFTAIRKKGKVVEDATFGFRAAAPAIMSHESQQTGQIYKWNPDTMKLIS